jgi:hypothetical protein
VCDVQRQVPPTQVSRSPSHRVQPGPLVSVPQYRESSGRHTSQSPPWRSVQ